MNLKKKKKENGLGKREKTGIIVQFVETTIQAIQNYTMNINKHHWKSKKVYGCECTEKNTYI